MTRLLLGALLSLSCLLSACGAQPGLTKPRPVASGYTGLGFGAEGGSQPSLLVRQSGETVVVYAGSNVGDRRLYWATSPDGTRFGTATAIGARAYSDQSPSLVEDAQGVVHCYFASNRNEANFEIYHTTLKGSTWSAPEALSGFTGASDLAVAYAAGRYMLTAEVLGEGLLAATSADGITFGAPDVLSEQGFEPAVTFSPAGVAYVAYTRSGQVFLTSSAPGADWSKEVSAAVGGDRLREPALAWGPTGGHLIYGERSGARYKLVERRFDAALSFSAGRQMPGTEGDCRSPALSFDHNGRSGLAWGMKNSSDQQGIGLTVLAP